MTAVEIAQEMKLTDEEKRHLCILMSFTYAGKNLKSFLKGVSDKTLEAFLKVLDGLFERRENRG